MGKTEKTMEKAYGKGNACRAGWAAFVEPEVVNFFKKHGLEKLSVEDGKGNKAKKDEEMKVVYSSVAIL